MVCFFALVGRFFAPMVCFFALFGRFLRPFQINLYGHIGWLHRHFEFPSFLLNGLINGLGHKGGYFALRAQHSVADI